MAIKYLIFFIIAISACLTIVKLKKLTSIGSIIGFTIALSVFSAFGFQGLAILATFFLTASLATSWKASEKQNNFSLINQPVTRDAFQVFANGGVASICSLLFIFLPNYQEYWLLMMAASFSSATADTISSELGTVYGTKFFNILTFKLDTKGENGVISFEGLLFGLAGSTIIATVFSFGFGFDFRFLIILTAGTIGNLADSLLGATLERNKSLNNNQVNFLNTFIAATSVLLFFCGL